MASLPTPEDRRAAPAATQSLGIGDENLVARDIGRAGVAPEIEPGATAARESGLQAGSRNAARHGLPDCS